MSYDHDIFLSYAHIDNEPYDDPKGWVDNFFKRLGIRLNGLLGREVDIWMDKRLQGNQYFVGEIGDRLTGTRFLVSVVSPRYVQSDWCRGELREFYSRAERNGGVRRKNLARLFKVVKVPVGDDQQPEELQGLPGYHFYEIDESERLSEFRQDLLAPNKDRRYWDKLNDLAWDIKKTIDGWGGGGPSGGGGGGASAAVRLGGEPSALPPKPQVYLAETAADIEGERDRVWRELTQREFRVLPDGGLPRTSADLRNFVREQLRGCALSVHMIGAGYGFVPEDGEDSVVDVQVQLAEERAREDSLFSRLVWMPPGLTSENERQRRFIDRLKTGLGAGAELLEASVEGLKTRILEKLKPRASGDEGRRDRKRIYLIHDERDSVEPIVNYLFFQGFKVVTSADAGVGEQAARHHRQSLLDSDAALIYYGVADPQWLSTKVWDLQKARGWGQRGRLAAAAFYLGPPRTPEKERLAADEEAVIANFGAFEPGALRPFLDALLTEKGGHR